MTNMLTEIKCSTCFYNNHFNMADSWGIKGQCQLDPKVCLGPRRANGEFGYHSWVEKIDGRSYADYFDAGGEALRDAVDKAILSDIVGAAGEGDRPRKITWGRLFIGLCVAYTAVGVFDVLTDALYHMIMMLDEIFIASP